MEKKKTTPPPVLDSYLQLVYLKAKVKWAEWMDRQSSRLGTKGIRILFIAVSTLFGTICLLLILSGGQLFYTKPHLRPDAIQTVRAPSSAIDKAASPDTTAMKQIKMFHNYMEDLSMTESGRKTRDSILEARPGLPDSIRILESIYNNKKSD
ncbi:MAG: hypothetical protein EOP54_10685 [Sphingobacteriales bacterium]|nr:MAG: hypothetical protein EOP54_10685 [Sphingobacteriales bacterium]